MSKQVECSVCGASNIPKREYTINIPVFQYYDAMDCKECGCQIQLGRRYDKEKKETVAIMCYNKICDPMQGLTNE